MHAVQKYIMWAAVENKNEPFPRIIWNFHIGMPDNRKKRRIGGSMGPRRYGLKQFQKSIWRVQRYVWAMMCLGVLMALMCHLGICQKDAPVRATCHLG